MTENKDMHKLLARQIKKFDIDMDSPILHDFLQAISETYTDADKDRHLIERSLDVSSSEMREVNTQLNKKLKELDQKTKEQEKINKFMIGREVRMAELKREIKELKRKYEP